VNFSSVVSASAVPNDATSDTRQRAPFHQHPAPGFADDDELLTVVQQRPPVRAHPMQDERPGA